MYGMLLWKQDNAWWLLKRTLLLATAAYATGSPVMTVLLPN
jgi:hypothetical protein